MLELRERNENKHVVSDNELVALAWAGYYTQCSNVFINGKEYRVIHITDSAIDFNNGISLPVGCYVIFENEDGIKICDEYRLREIRKENPLKKRNYYFNESDFLKIA